MGIDENTKSFAQILHDELSEIRDRREQAGFKDAPSPGLPYRLSDNLVGLALSGGGIRSATFCLGLLQGMRKCGLLHIFDYLSTVSGGGYVGGWWSAWLARQPLLGVEDLKNAGSFATKLNDHADGFSRELYERLSPGTRELLDSYSGDELPEDLKQALVDDLNNIIAAMDEKADDSEKRPARCLFGPHYPEVELTNRARQLLKHHFITRRRRLVAFDRNVPYSVRSYEKWREWTIENRDHAREAMKDVETLVDDIRRSPALIERSVLKQVIDRHRGIARNEAKKTLKSCAKVYGIYLPHEYKPFPPGLKAVNRKKVKPLRPPDDDHLARLNRLLLQCAYPDEIDVGLFPPREGIEPKRAQEHDVEAEGATGNPDAPGSASCETLLAGADPIHHLRLFANYLTPRKGLFSSDTWRVITVLTRNVAMSWLVLVPMLVAVVLFGQLYFVFQENPEGNFINPTPFNQHLSAKEKRKIRWDVQTEWKKQGLPLSSALVDQEAKTREEKQQEASKQNLLARVEDKINRRLKLGDNRATMYLELKGKAEQGDDAGAKIYEEFKQNLWGNDDSIGKYKELLGEEKKGDESAGNYSQAFHLMVEMGEQAARSEAREARAWFAAKPLLAIIGWIVVMGMVWLACTMEIEETTDLIVVGVSTAVVIAVIVCVIHFMRAWDDLAYWWVDGLGWHIFWLAGSVALVTYSMWRPRVEITSGGSQKREAQRRKDIWRERRNVWRNKVTQVQAKLQAAFLFVAFVLLIAGFGHEIREFLYLDQSIYGYASDFAKWTAIIASILGSLFTLYKVRPRGGADKQETGEPTRISRFIFAATPPLVLLVLAIMVAWVGHELLCYIYRNKEIVEYLNYAIVLSIPLYFALAMYEMQRTKDGPSIGLFTSLWVLAVPAIWVTYTLFAYIKPEAFEILVALGVVATTLSTSFLVRLLMLERKRRKGNGIQLARKDLVLNGAIAIASIVLAIIFTAATDRSEAVDSKTITESGLVKLINDIAKLQSFRHIWLYVLPLFISSLVGGLILYRWMVIEKRPSPRTFEPGKLKRLVARLSEHKAPGLEGDAREEACRKNSLWLLGSLCFVIAVAFTCLLYEGLEEINKRVAEKTVPSSAVVERVDWPYVVMVVCVTVLAAAIFFFRKERALKPNCRKWVQASSGMIGLTMMVVMFYLAGRILAQAAENQPQSKPLTTLTFAAIVLCFTLLRFEMRLSVGNNRRSLALLTSAYVALLILLVVSLLPNLKVEHQSLFYGHAVIGLIATTLAWVIGLGWMADPNAFSMHAFYKARLVRAYTGASNYRRREQKKNITEPAANDDVFLKHLKNGERGAPYHLVNTTLNLVAARDLATAQRSAASFVLSQLYCGSSRTRYRPTNEFMNGRLSLGGAVAISGAAASPNMGARTPSAALAMLMTLLNVRLGYWAPTPNRKFWRSPQARLWPFYLVREFLSHTNDLSEYCYLTDGGHFDNTGLYSLIERGCRYIVVADCGADPKSSFGDLGDVIRRCRIDFGAEIRLDIKPFIRAADKSDDKSIHRVPTHYIVGEIIYSADHWRQLKGGTCGAGGSDKKERTGKIVVLKPSITDRDLADIKQYQLENQTFPQQSTTNQWFDEAQFESYRRLGEVCALSAFEDLDVDRSKAPDNYSVAFIEELFSATEKRCRAALAEQPAPTKSPATFAPFRPSHRSPNNRARVS